MKSVRVEQPKGPFKLVDEKVVEPARRQVRINVQACGILLSTAPDAKGIPPLVDSLGVGGRLVIVGARVEPFALSSMQLLLTHRTIIGWPSGTSKDSEDTLKFAAMTGVRAMIETFPIEKASDGYDRMITGKVRFRAVLMH